MFSMQRIYFAKVSGYCPKDVENCLKAGQVARRQEGIGIALRQLRMFNGG